MPIRPSFIAILLDWFVTPDAWLSAKDT